MVEVKVCELLSYFFGLWFVIIWLMILLVKARRERDRLARQPFIKQPEDKEPNKKEDCRYPIGYNVQVKQITQSRQTKKTYNRRQDNFTTHIKRIIKRLTTKCK
jgi:hypothetical protein